MHRKGRLATFNMTNGISWPIHTVWILDIYNKIVVLYRGFWCSRPTGRLTVFCSALFNSGASPG